MVCHHLAVGRKGSRGQRETRTTSGGNLDELEEERRIEGDEYRVGQNDEHGFEIVVSRLKKLG
jgi:hypothetical protein